ncbi:hypothetical protein CRUP_004865 [Coryphaenoides rupestris]|nr:hypothetical protein CRUP_004865 [Coryphaenoides rupestris]
MGPLRPLTIFTTIIIIIFCAPGPPVGLQVSAAQVCEDPLSDVLSPPQHLHAFRNLCYEFVDAALDWFEAEDACLETGGELLEWEDGASLLRGLVGESLDPARSWWLGERMKEQHDPPKPPMGVARELTQPIEILLESYDDELYFMETNITGLTNDNRDLFISTLAKTTKTMSSKYARTNNVTISRIFACCKAIRLLSEKKCDLDTNPNPEVRMHLALVLLRLVHLMLVHLMLVHLMLVLLVLVLLVLVHLTASETPAELLMSLFEMIYEIYATIGILLVTDEPLVLVHDSGTLYQIRLSPDELGSAEFTSEPDGPSIKLPSYDSIKNKVEQYPQIIAQLGSFRKLPHQINQSIMENVCSFSLSHELDPIALDNLSEMIEVFIPNNASGVRNESLEMTVSSTIMTSFNVTDTNATIIFDVRASDNASVLLLLAMGSPPNATNASSSTILNHTDGYRWMVTPDMLEEGEGEWFIKASLFNITEEEECLCNHLTLFGNSFFVMPNALDLSQTAALFSTITENFVVLALLCAFFGLYVATVLWAWYSDRRSLIRRKITILEDNHPCASYNYLLSVQTGQRKNGGTSSNVTVRLIGADGESETQRLVDEDKPVFERGAVDMFLLATPFPLGELRSLRLQHDSTGGHPSWSIKPRVSIRDQKKKELEIKPMPTVNIALILRCNVPVLLVMVLQETEEVLMTLCQSPKNNVCGLEDRLESTYQLRLALDKIHQVLMLMQGEGESNPHWVFCSRYVLLCLAHLLQCLEKLDVKHFHSAEDAHLLFDITNQLLLKAEMVYTSHKAAWKKKKVSGGLSLPWWFVFIAWFLLLSISGISTFFTLLYGLKYGKEKSIQWVISLGLSLFQSIFILQPLKLHTTVCDERCVAAVLLRL